jgi:hypothetical protein
MDNSPDSHPGAPARTETDVELRDGRRSRCRPARQHHLRRRASHSILGKLPIIGYMFDKASRTEQPSSGAHHPELVHH